MELFFSIAMPMAVFQFAVGVIGAGLLLTEAHDSYLDDGEKLWLKISTLTMLTSPLSIVIVPIALALGLVYIVIYFVKNIIKNWN